ncbi:MAG: protein TolR [Candidatus Electrothrix sp. AW2]|jgi:biopolymer transport protein TolR|nr:protein TolR [Candidatus Electrothrix sp. AX1]MCI5116937.1 protein TolR [Candidatus Electrothrix gigas]MCI5127804.1 protein TolR [Candidatus Electrothrix gigas]MCI5133663.1 protein TolR [Candidatus Electrothrix gigas]MCI5178739.1 protein TolR [Candidatus Electrothrix gigas]
MGPSGRGRKGLVAEINVTPLVDVMLVLLIIFMVTAPMMTEGVDIDLPKTTSRALRQQEEPLIVQIDKSGVIYLGKDKTRVNLALVWQELEKKPLAMKKQPIYLRADKNVPYGLVVQVMAQIKRAGFEKLGMITEPDDKEN